MQCPNCGVQVWDDETQCPECGYVVGANESRRQGENRRYSGESRQGGEYRQGGGHGQSSGRQPEGRSAPPPTQGGYGGTGQGRQGQQRDPSRSSSPVNQLGDLFPKAGFWWGFRGFFAVVVFLFLVTGLSIALVGTGDINPEAGAGENIPDEDAAIAMAGAIASLFLLDGLVNAIIHVFAWLLYNAHFIDIVVSGEVIADGQTLQSSAGFSFLSPPLDLDLSIIPYMYYVVPPVVLVLCGRGLVKDREFESPVAAAAAGAQIVVGYLPFLLALAWYVSIDAAGTEENVSISASVGPEMTMVVLLGGLYAIAFGAIGGYLTKR